ncbi:TIGR03790 family protein [Desulforhabdus sp. TSK]|uniref:TIGR03790 family protein n=1 Tax=Desulforhabdus sp. TSK TaxID=2925014 RepID=UPI001FC85E8E|nr:TIGR03790 family protein [Desulforhabdus sp. TSK]GKT06876.1 hypothetical protein DSTSK_01810 [Desulforhabdus sp. TSK]
MNRPPWLIALWFLCLPAVCLFPAHSLALEPSEILVVANGRASLDLARYYMAKRHIPEANIVVLRTTDKEHCSRADYEAQILVPLRKHLHEREAGGSPVRALLLMQGVPLAITEPKLSLDEKAHIRGLQLRRRAIQREIKIMPPDEKKLEDLKKALESMQAEIQKTNRDDESASVDSELTLALEGDYPLSGWLPNPSFVGFRGKDVPNLPKRVLMVARLDGPSPAVVRRMIDDSLAAEEKGLAGKAYFDARWPALKSEKPSGYAFYDDSIHKAADVVKKSGAMPVTLDEEEKLFQPGEAPDAALYCGWYSLARYVPAFTWAQGSVGYHIASQECQTLRQEGSQVWCKSMLENGAAATVGPVAEPYVQAFPVPEVFFAALLEGNLTLSECYTISLPFLSWRMVLVGDPLYRPFKARGKKSGAERVGSPLPPSR